MVKPRTLNEQFARAVSSTKAMAEFLLDVRLDAAMRATNAQKAQAMRRLAESVRAARRLTPEHAGLLADLLAGKAQKPKGGRPKEADLHRLIADVYAMRRREYPDASVVTDDAIYDHLAAIKWPAEWDSEGTAIKFRRLSKRAVRAIIDRLKAKGYRVRT